MTNNSLSIIVFLVVTFFAINGGLITFLVLEDRETKPAEEVVVVPEQPKIVETVETPVPDIDAREVHCLALNIWFESRGTDKDDRLAVAHVTKNRVKSAKYPENVCAVVFQGVHAKHPVTGAIYPIRNMCQFSWYCDGKSDEIKLTDKQGRTIRQNVMIWEECQTIAFDVLTGMSEDPTDGATHYLNEKLVKNMPRWTTVYTKVYETNGHQFYKM